jgi:hypothetical protein
VARTASGTGTAEGGTALGKAGGDDRRVTVDAHRGLDWAERLVAKALLVPGEPFGFGQREPHRPDAAKVLGEQRIELAGVSGALGRAPLTEE